MTQRPDRIEIRADNQLIGTAREFFIREDVAAWLQIESAKHSGWSIEVPHGAIRSFRYQVVTVSAFSAEGVERILFHGAVESLAGTIAKEKAKQREDELARRELEMGTLRHELAVAAHQRDGLAQTVEAMRRSRFWKAREQWFRVKRAAGLTDEG